MRELIAGPDGTAPHRGGSCRPSAGCFLPPAAAPASTPVRPPAPLPLRAFGPSVNGPRTCAVRRLRRSRTRSVVLPSLALRPARARSARCCSRRRHGRGTAAEAFRPSAPEISPRVSPVHRPPTRAATRALIAAPGPRLAPSRGRGVGGRAEPGFFKDVARAQIPC